MARSGIRTRRHDGWQERATGRMFGAVALTSTLAAVVLTLGLLTGAWLISRTTGGAGVVPPHWFYVPIIFAAVRFGALGAFAASVAATFLAGPALPLDVTAGATQPVSDWATRGAFFVAVGQFLALVLHERLTVRIQQLHHARMHRALRKAMTRGELEVHYQGIYNIGSRRRRLMGAEALIRWQHPTRGIIGADEFIHIAERDASLIDDLCSFVIEDVAHRIAEWQHLTDAEFVSVNLSGRQLGSRDLVDRVRACIDDAGIDASRLCFEVTETAALVDIDVSRQGLQALRDLGARIAIDDFGTGYSSLARLHQLPVDIVKIDRSFVTRMVDEPEASALVANTILLAHTLGFDALAEGTETPKQLKLLKSMGCDFAQGYHLHKPSPAGDVTAMLAKERRRRRAADRRTPNARLAHTKH